jgi:hypothetical protein
MLDRLQRCGAEADGDLERFFVVVEGAGFQLGGDSFGEEGADSIVVSGRTTTKLFAAVAGKELVAADLFHYQCQAAVAGEVAEFVVSFLKWSTSKRTSDTGVVDGAPLWRSLARDDSDGSLIQCSVFLPAPPAANQGVLRPSFAATPAMCERSESCGGFGGSG